MAEAVPLIPGADLRAELERVGAGHASRCYQCATCTSVCALSTPEHPFPRRQVLAAQWGLTDRVVGDPAVWLCYQCADCSEHCPRDVRPGDVMQGLRAVAIRALAFPRFAGQLVSRARVTWPLMVGIPWLFWVVLLLGLRLWPVAPEALAHEGYEAVVPHWLLYSIFFPVAGWVVLASAVSGSNLWKLIGRHGPPRQGSFLGALGGAVADIALHRNFGDCSAKPNRRTGHLLLFWGFVGAAVTSALLIVGIYIQHLPMPLPLWHPYKLLGNLSAVALVVGGILLIVQRYGAGRSLVGSNAFDNFFLGLVAAVIITGVLTEVVRLATQPQLAFALYTLHLGVVLALFLTFPYSKFAHMLYRTLALVHQRMTATGTGN